MNAVIFPLVEGAVAGVLRGATGPPRFSPPFAPGAPPPPPVLMVAPANSHQSDALVYLVCPFRVCTVKVAGVWLKELLYAGSRILYCHSMRNRCERGRGESPCVCR